MSHNEKAIPPGTCLDEVLFVFSPTLEQSGVPIRLKLMLRNQKALLPIALNFGETGPENPRVGSSILSISIKNNCLLKYSVSPFLAV